MESSVDLLMRAVREVKERNRFAGYFGIKVVVSAEVCISHLLSTFTTT